MRRIISILMFKRILCLILSLNMCLSSVIIVQAQDIFENNDINITASISSDSQITFSPSNVTVKNEATRDDIIRYVGVAPEKSQEAEEMLAILENMDYSAEAKVDILTYASTDAFTLEECIDKYNSTADKATYRREMREFTIFSDMFDKEEIAQNGFLANTENRVTSNQKSLFSKA